MILLLFYFVFPANRNFALVPVSKSTLFFLTFKKLIYVLQTKKNLHCVKQIMILYQIFSVIFSWHANVAQRPNFKRTRSLGENLLELSFWIKTSLYLFSLYSYFQANSAVIDDPGGQVMRVATCQPPGEAGVTRPDTSRGYTATTLCTTSEQSWQQQLSTFITVLLQTGCRKKYFILVENNKKCRSAHI